MRIQRNILANFLGRAWGFAAVYLFVPVYLRFLGIDGYGLVGFYSTLLGVIAFADMGFTATLNREMARHSGTGSAAGMRDLLRTYELTYGAISTVVALVIWSLAPAIAGRWLHSTVLSPSEMTATIRAMGIAIAFQLPSGLFIGGLMGLQRQVRANVLQIAWGALQGIGAVLVLRFVSRTVIAFAVWQLVANAVYCFSVRYALWKSLPEAGDHRPSFAARAMKETWRYAAGMVGISIIGILLTQIDKVIISKLQPLPMLGYYTLAITVASIPVTLANVVGAAVFPRLTEHVARGDREGLALVYHKAFALMAVAIIPVGLTLAAFAGAFVYAWTGSADVARQVAPVATLLVLGQLLQALAVVPYYLGLANGNVNLSLKIGITSVIIVTPALWLLIIRFGILGAGMSWLLLNLCTLPVNMYFLHRWFLPEGLRRSLISVGASVLVVLPCVMLARWLVPATPSRIVTFVEFSVVGAVALAAATLVVPGFFATVRENALRLGTAAKLRMS